MLSVVLYTLVRDFFANLTAEGGLEAVLIIDLVRTIDTLSPVFQ